MAESNETSTPPAPVQVDLRNPAVAAFWAWFWPGAGHLYQRRYGKGVLFMVCILSTYFFGLALGGGHVVYAAWKKPDRRWAYLCQVGVGLPALPALVQSRRVRVEGKPPLWNEFMAPPKALPGKTENTHDKTSDWHLQYGTLFDIGTLYTMIAGLLNVLAVYDAFAGPVGMEPGRSTDKPPPKK